MNFKVILGILLVGITALFIIQNVTTMELTFLFWTMTMSRALLMILILSAGIILGWMMHRGFGKKKTISIQSKTL